jgi:hypothetical protein
VFLYRRIKMLTKENVKGENEAIETAEEEVDVASSRKTERRKRVGKFVSTVIIILAVILGCNIVSVVSTETARYATVTILPLGPSSILGAIVAMIFNKLYTFRK